jgi:hypothetical protein
MSLERSRRLMDILIRKTERGEIDWQETLPNVYQVSFKDNSVQLSESDNEPSNHDSFCYVVSLLNSEGAVADRFTDEDLDIDEFKAVGGGWFGKLAELFVRARRRARGADKVLDDILKLVDDDDSHSGI